MSGNGERIPTNILQETFGGSLNHEGSTILHGSQKTKFKFFDLKQNENDFIFRYEGVPDSRFRVLVE